MTTHDPFVVGPPGDRSRPWRVVADGSRSNGMALGDAWIPPGAPGPGRHVHTHEDEGIYVVAGVLTVEVGDERHEVGPESFVWLPREVPHAFANLSGAPVRMFFQSSAPGGHENYFRELAELLRGGGPPDQATIAGLRERYDMVQLTPLRAAG